MRFIKSFLFFFPRIIRKLNGAYLLYKVKSHKGQIFIGGKTNLTKNTILGQNPNFNGLTVVGHGEVIFGDNFHSGPGCLIITSNHNFDSGNAIPYDDTNIVKSVIINDNVWLGSRVIVLGGVEIGEGAIIQAGAVVVNNIPPCAIAGGNPAKVFKYRNKEHYFRLKEQKKFH